MEPLDTVKVLSGVKSVEKLQTYYQILYDSGEEARIHILNNHVFKLQMDPEGKFPEYPKPINPEDVAKINCKRVSDYDTSFFNKSHVTNDEKTYFIHTQKIHIALDKISAKMSVFDKRTNKEVLSEALPLSYIENKSKQTLRQEKDEYFFGGGMQNGRFTHKGNVIHIVNMNNWVDGCVTSPCPFYWSTKGYGVLRNTWQAGLYDFGKKNRDTIKTIHKGQEFDAFYFINAVPRDILTDYFELTGRPIFMPEYAFYEAHLNTFNRDYWVKVSPDTKRAILFEDGFYYKRYQPKDMNGKNGILESLNGEKNNYQFSARAMVDRYISHDIPLGWFVPNDGYGSGYGQTDSLDGDIQNLSDFADYARARGIDVALWTESQLEPKNPQKPKKGERDLHKEISVAGVAALKCDVAWIGDGYSFALSAVENAQKIFLNSTQRRPMIIMVDGWAGTQRHAGIWSGDQKGGEWEYIRFHIPTYIGSGLSGIPLVGSDMDGIYAGKSLEVNVRDFQWKAFTPLQLNMDGWGDFRKTPFTFGTEATAINRAYLKLKSMLMPYNYTIGYESTHGLPMIRAMFLEFADENNGYTNDAKYQFMWGPYILVAPIYKPKGNLDDSIRDGVYLPEEDQVWIDFFTGEKYQGGLIWGNVIAPLWKIPVFIKEGAILPMTHPNNNPGEIRRDERIFQIYPHGKTSFEVYEDDGKTGDYLKGQHATTSIEVLGSSDYEISDLLISIGMTVGTYKDMVKERSTLLRIMCSQDIKNVKVAIKGNNVEMKRVDNDADFERNVNVYYYKEDFLVNPYLREASSEVETQKFLLIKVDAVDVTTNNIQVKIQGYTNKADVFGSNMSLNESLEAPYNLTAIPMQSYATLVWLNVDDASYYEIEKDGSNILFTNLSGPAFTFENVDDGEKHTFRIRSVNKDGYSAWSNEVQVIIKNPYMNIIDNVSVTSSVQNERGYSVFMLSDGDPTTMWHTDENLLNLADPSTDKYFNLNFDLGGVETLEKMEYVPRNDAGSGTVLKMQYKLSKDGPFSEVIEWKADNKVKTIELGGQSARFIEWKILETVGGRGSGKEVLFYRADKQIEK